MSWHKTTMGRAISLKPIFSSYAMSGGALASASIAQLATFAMLARALGPVEFGLFVQVAAISAIGIQICGLGASDSLFRRIVQAPERYPDLLGHNLLLIGLSAAVLVPLAAAGLSFWLTMQTGPGLGLPSIVLLLVTNILLVRAILLVETIYLGLGREAAANRSVVGFALARTATAALACTVFGVDTLAGWAAWQFCGNLLYALLCAAWLLPLGRPRAVILREELRPGLLFSSQFAMRALRQNADLFVVGLFASIETVASYGVARRIMDSSYITIDSMNRLVYRRFVRASRDGLHRALPDAGRVLVGAVVLGSGTALLLFLLAPWLGLAFGRAYDEVTFFVRCLSGTIALIAVWSVAIDLLGASGRQGARAMILSTVNLLGGGLIAAASWLAGPSGAIVALYAIEAGTAAAAWLVLLSLAARSRGRALSAAA